MSLADVLPEEWSGQKVDFSGLKSDSKYKQLFQKLGGKGLRDGW